MTDAAEHAWVPWRACPPDPGGGPVEVLSDAWQGTRLWRPSGPPPEGITGLTWRRAARFCCPWRPLAAFILVHLGRARGHAALP